MHEVTEAIYHNYLERITFFIGGLYISWKGQHILFSSHPQLIQEMPITSGFEMDREMFAWNHFLFPPSFPLIQAV